MLPGLVLKAVLSNPDKALEYWAKLKGAYFGAGYNTVFSVISKFYSRHGRLPDFPALFVQIERDASVVASLKAIQRLDVQVELDILVEALLDRYVQNEALISIDKLISNITVMSSAEIKEHLSNLVLFLEEKTHTTEQVFTMADIDVYDAEELGSKVYLGINNTFDAYSGGVSLTELIMIGGYRGSGKSIVSVNLAINQYLAGNVGVVFSIEMRAREVFERTISALAGVPFSKLRKGTLSQHEYDKVAKVRSEMFLDGEKYLEQYKEHGDYVRFERELRTGGSLLQDNQIIIVDNQTLSLADVDISLQKMKAQFGDKLKVVVIDYVNQLAIEDMYNWQSQIALSKGLKNLARKYNVVIVTPYQIDKGGEARFAKGLLDAADISFIITAQDNAIEFKTTKVRNMAANSFASEMNWETLRLSATDAPKQEKETTTTAGDDLPY